MALLPKYHQISKTGLILILIGLIQQSIVVTNGDIINCDNEQGSLIMCHGSRIVRSVVDNVISQSYGEKPFKLVPGLEIVTSYKSLNINDSVATEQSSADNQLYTSGVEGGNQRITDNNSGGAARGGQIGYIDRVMKYLQNHELKINFSDLLKKTEFNEVISRTFNDMDSENEIIEGRKKDKGGLGTVLITALMMKKMLAALGMGAVAALAAKALGVALIALLLSGLLGLKKLTEGGGEDHHVQYVTAHSDHHRRRKREINNDLPPLPYRAWIPKSSTSPSS